MISGSNEASRSNRRRRPGQRRPTAGPD